jgi:hypothetical protein
MSDTPRTDVMMVGGPLQRPTLAELADHARRLERENTRLRGCLETIRDFGGDPTHGFADGEQCAKQAKQALEETK